MAVASLAARPKVSVTRNGRPGGRPFAKRWSGQTASSSSRAPTSADGCRSFDIARASIWRMRSRVRPKCSATSSSVRSPPPSRPKRRREDRALALVEHRQHLGHLAGQQRGGRGVERGGRVAVLDEVAELGVAVVTHGLVERDRVDRVAEHFDDLLERQLGLGRQLGQRRRAAERAFELGAQLEQRGEHVAGVHGQPDDARRVGDAALDRLADPPGRVRRELEALAPVELVDGVDQAEVALLHDVEQGQTRGLVLLRDRDDEPQVRVHELAVRLLALADRHGGACGAGWG